MTACLPDDCILSLRFSPDSKTLAYVQENKGLSAMRVADRRLTLLAGREVAAPGFSWSPDGRGIAYVSDEAGNWDIKRVDLDGTTTRLTRSLARQSSPMYLPNGDLLFMSTGRGKNDLLIHNPETGSDPLYTSDAGIINPRLSPDADTVAFVTFDALRPRLALFNLKTTTCTMLTPETDALSLDVNSLAWSPRGDRLTYTRHAVTSHGEASSVLACDPRTRRESILATNLKGRIRDAQLGRDGRTLYYLVGDRLMIREPNARNARELPFQEFAVSCPTQSSDGRSVAFVAAQQLLGVADNSLRHARFLLSGFEDRFLLAEEYFQKGDLHQSSDLYRELASSVLRAEDPVSARFLYVANQQRLGRNADAVRAMEEMLARGEVPAGIPQGQIWKTLGYTYLFSLDEYPKAHRALDNYTSASRGQRISARDDRMLSCAKTLLETSNPQLLSLYTEAVRARLHGDFPATSRLFGRLLDRYGSIDAVREQYLHALDGFDAEVYFFNPSQRPFAPTPKQRLDYLQHFLKHAPPGPMTDSARFALFQTQIESGRYAEARALLTASLDEMTDPKAPDDLAAVFADFIERPEAAPWLQSAMRQVFLHPTVRPLLDEHLASPRARFLLRLSAAKMAIAADAPEQLRIEADAALGAWNQIPSAERSFADHGQYARLLLMRGREAELRGLFSEALTMYDQAESYIAESRADAFEMLFESRYRSELLRYLSERFPSRAKALAAFEHGVGDELLNPASDPAQLAAGLREQIRQYDLERAAGSPLQYLAAYRAGVLYGRLGLDAHARAAYHLVVRDANAPAFIRAKSLIELAAIDETGNDPFNSARWLTQASDMPGCTLYEKQWLSYMIARLHLRLDYKTREARDALSIIANTDPETPLAIQATELLKD